MVWDGMGVGRDGTRIDGVWVLAELSELQGRP